VPPVASGPWCQLAIQKSVVVAGSDATPVRYRQPPRDTLIGLIVRRRLRLRVIVARLLPGIFHSGGIVPA